MDLTTAQFAQLIGALAVGVVLFVAAFVASEKSVVAFIVVTLPFQPITSSFGTVNTVLIFMAGLVWLLRGRFKRTPMLGLTVFIFFALMLAVSQAPRATYSDHFFYLIGMTGNFVLFYIVYNFFRRPENSPEMALRLFMASGFLVAAFSITKFFVSFESYSVFGIEEFSVYGNREAAGARLVGAFNAVGVNGAFYGMQILMCLFYLLNTKKTLVRLFLLVLILANSALLVATGSRGSFLTSVFGFVLFLVLYLRYIGVGRAILLAGGAAAVAVIGGILVIQYTDFNVLFDRLGGTTTQGFVPDTRQVAFEQAFERIPEAMVFGHGPRLRLVNEHTRRIPNYQFMNYPHNLYLHMLLTTGIVGLIAWLTWFLALATRLIKAARRRNADKSTTGTVRLGVLILIVFLVDELKIEFLRFPLLDYQNYMFALFAMFLAFADRVLAPLAETRAPNRYGPRQAGPGRTAIPA